MAETTELPRLKETASTAALCSVPLSPLSSWGLEAFGPVA